MIRIPFLLSVFLGYSTAFAQSPARQRTDSVALLVKQYLNAYDTSNLYNLTGLAYKAAFNEEKWKAIAPRIFAMAPLHEITFKVTRNGVSKYKLTGTQTTVQMLMSLDTGNKIVTLVFQPYQEEKDYTVASTNKKTSTQDSIIDKWVAPYISKLQNVGVSIGIYRNGARQYYHYGETVRGSHQLPDTSSLYEICSITKTFTALLLANAVQEQKIKLTDPVTCYLPDSLQSNEDLQKITVKQLANHTSGLPDRPANLDLTITDTLNPLANYSNADMFSFLRSFKAVRDTGSKWEYSNLGFGLLGVILENIIHKPYEQQVREIICKPLQLRNTTITLNEAQKLQLTQGYNKRGEATPHWDFKSMAGAGALRSNITDLLSYGIAQLQPERQLAQSIILTQQPTFSIDKFQKAGLAWRIIKGELYHDGGNTGYRCILIVNPAQKTVVAVLTNNADTGDRLGMNMMDAFRKL